MGMARTVAAVFGAVYVIVGLVGFVIETPLFGLFEVSLAHNIAHLVIGAILLYGATSTSAAVMTLRGVGALLVVLGILGFFEPFPDFLPLGGADIWLHLATGAILLIAGFMGAAEPATA
jgi:Domain of unknown function (DUF4383)